MADALLSIQIIPKTEKNEDTYPLVDEAIKIIADSGVKYQVNPLETTMEGKLSYLLQIVEKINERMIEKGCISAISQIKVFYKPDGASMSTLTEKYR